MGVPGYSANPVDSRIFHFRETILYLNDANFLLDVWASGIMPALHRKKGMILL